MKIIKIGVCIFDDPRSPQSGYASLGGAEPSYISGYHELSSEHLWVTNLEFPVFKELNLLRLRHLAHTQYFRTKIQLLQVELGITENRRLAQILSSMFTRCGALGYQFFGADPKEYNYRYHQALGDHIHIPGMTQPIQGMDSNVVQLVIDHSTQENQAMAGVKRPDRSTPTAFYFPRDAYSQWLFGRSYPVSNVWKSDGLKNIKREYTIGTRDGKKIALTDTFVRRFGEYFKSNGRATFFNVAILSQEESHRAFASFGAGSKDPRVWVTWPELLELVEYSVVTISDSISTACGGIREHLHPFCHVNGHGISDGLLLENLYVALCSPVNRRNTALGAYIRAYDRAACGRAAKVFHDAGFVVGSYSMGRVILLLTEGQKERARQVALDFGMLPPLREEASNE